MYKQNTTVECKTGLYNDQVTYFVQRANEFRCSIHLECGTRRMNAKSLLGIMSMCIDRGASVTLIADGPDEQVAVETLCQMLRQDVH